MKGERYNVQSFMLVVGIVVGLQRFLPQRSQRSRRGHREEGRPSLHLVHGDTAEELGVEVGGFLGHDFAVGGYVHDQVDVDGIEEKGDLRFALVDGVEGIGGFPFVGEVGFGGDGVWRDAEGGFENALMEEDDVEFALQRSKAGKNLRGIGFGAKGEEIEGSGARFGCGIGADGAPGFGFREAA